MLLLTSTWAATLELESTSWSHNILGIHCLFNLLQPRNVRYEQHKKIWHIIKSKIQKMDRPIGSVLERQQRLE